MNYALKLLIPVGLGVAAAVINWMVLSSGTMPVHYVTVTQPLEVGDTFSLEYAEPLPVPPSFSSLSRTMVPFEDRGVLSGRVVRRRIETGDPIFFADTDLGGEWLDLEPDEELFPVSLDDVSADPKLLRIGNMIRFRVPALAGDETGPTWVGPFRIVTVGSKINNNFSEDDSYGSSGTLSIGIAYNAKKNATLIKRLEEFCDQQKKGEAALLGIRIVDRR